MANATGESESDALRLDFDPPPDAPLSWFRSDLRRLANASPVPIAATLALEMIVRSPVHSSAARNRRPDARESHLARDQ